MDGSGNLYIADQNNQRIQKVAADGTVTTVAGTGQRGFSGDGGAATAAQLNFPYDVAVDGSGNLYIVDRDNQRIRKVAAADGTITTVAGTGQQGFSGDGGAATAARLNFPNDVAVDGSGNFYIGDLTNLGIRKVDADGNISTVGGGRWGTIYGLAVDGSGNLYMANRNEHRIRKVATDGTTTTVAGTGERGFYGDGGRATAAELSLPDGVAADGSGNLYIADTRHYRIHKIDAAGNIATIAGDGTNRFGGDGGSAVEAQLDFPWSTAADGSGNLYIADTFNHRIRKVDAAGNIATVAGTGTLARISHQAWLGGQEAVCGTNLRGS